MNIYYAKSVLYAYPHIESIMGQLDELVERKALCSINDYSPCVEIAEKILDFTAQKDVFISLKIVADKVLKKFTEDEIDCFDYKYFRQKPKEYFTGFDSESRGYFRKQVKLAKKFSMLLEKAGATDDWFENNCMKMDFFKDMYKRVIEHEKNTLKNKAKKPKKTNISTISDYRKKELSA